MTHHLRGSRALDTMIKVLLRAFQKILLKKKTIYFQQETLKNTYSYQLIHTYDLLFEENAFFFFFFTSFREKNQH